MLKSWTQKPIQENHLSILITPKLSHEDLYHASAYCFNMLYLTLAYFAFENKQTKAAVITENNQQKKKTTNILITVKNMDVQDSAA